ncbi:membrane protein [Arcticibacter tournemirensis]|uniref:YihY/virulence factor BrkB family protein n=1 Tax=Arcticibacter tournemirensis TaxID=699437 RepID=A0A5M9H3T6_9SPHI|nr:YihY/virulence factor BrkB family protein [Arcticibacter tournemirensis]KAA8480037.1 YihY/virulence factor BrkB family protein [Arcticibacter tournemirensis]TQM50639.1 membrane protein [Arcticibacter tournemirensis]
MIQRFLLKVKIYKRFMDWTKKAVFPVFSPLPIYTVGSFFFQEVTRDSLITKASSLAYSFMLAIFPGLIFLFTLIPYIPIDGFQDQLMSLISMLLPSNAYGAVQSTLEDIIKKQNGGLLSFGFLAALFFSTNGVTNLMQAFNKASLQPETRGWFKQRFVAIVLTVVTVFALIFGLAVITAGEFIIAKIKTEIQFKEWFWLYVIALVRWVILAVVYFTTISILYRYGPSYQKKWKLFSPGSWLATILAILTSWGFTYYINNFSNYNKLYGSIGTLIVIMIWLFLNSLIILIGFELNASIDLSKRSIKIIRPRFNTFKDEPVQETFQKNLPK